MQHFSAGLSTILITLGLLCGLSASAADAFKIDKCKTYVSIAAVKLTVGELIEKDGNLVGSYEIKIPLKSSKNDWGQIVLPLSTSVSELGKNGGTLRGKAISICETEAPRDIVCEVQPDKQRILLAITTPDRTLNFESSYKVVKAGKGS